MFQLCLAADGTRGDEVTSSDVPSCVTHIHHHRSLARLRREGLWEGAGGQKIRKRENLGA